MIPSTSLISSACVGKLRVAGFDFSAGSSSLKEEDPLKVYTNAALTQLSIKKQFTPYHVRDLITFSLSRKISFLKTNIVKFSSIILYDMIWYDKSSKLCFNASAQLCIFFSRIKYSWNLQIFFSKLKYLKYCLKQWSPTTAPRTGAGRWVIWYQATQKYWLKKYIFYWLSECVRLGQTLANEAWMPSKQLSWQLYYPFFMRFVFSCFHALKILF